MKQRIFTVVLALCLLISSQSAAYAWPEDSLPQENALTEESASGLSAHDSTVPTPTEVYEAMTALKNEDAYKEGTTWTNDEPYSDLSGYYSWKGGPLGGTNILAAGCAAFAFILSDAAFGSLKARMYAAGEFSYEDIKVGDILQVNNDSHTVIVLEVSDTGVVIAEGNYNSSVHWGRTMSKDYVMNNASHYITRYPEGYVSPDDPGANDIIRSGSLDGGLTWTLTKAGTITISGSGAMPDFSSTEDQPWSSYSSQIRKVVIENGVTSIGSCAFWNCGILSAEIPSSVTAIGNSAFRGSSIISAVIPSSVTTIGDSAFHGCQGLNSITVSEGVVTIGQNAFRACTSLTSIALPASIGEVGAAAFFECTTMKSATFAAGSKQVKFGDNIFTRCYDLINVTLPQSIDCIGNGMFQNCKMLAKAEIPQGAESIGEAAFASCSSLTTVVIPDSVSTIGTAAFSATSLADIYFTGTEAQWNRISKLGDTASVVSNTTVHYGYVPDPTTPSDPTTPDTPTTPDDPTTPGNPTTPGTPTTPDKPVTPSKPATPDQTTPSKPTAPDDPEPPASTPDTTVPFIEGVSGKEGWEVIKEETANASGGKWINVNMNGTSVVPGDVLDSVKGRNITISFDMGNGITWFVNGRNVTADHANDMDLSVQVGTSAIPQNIVDNTAQNRPTIQLSLAHSGDFGCSAVLMINVGAANAKLYANLFYYNERTGKLEFTASDQINKDGTAELTFTHASDYVIVVSDNVMNGSPDGTSSQSNSKSTSANGSGSPRTGTRRSPRTGEF